MSDEELTWPSLSNGPLTPGTYYVTYTLGKQRFHEVNLNVKGFDSLEDAIFGENGALNLLSGEIEAPANKGEALFVVIYQADTNGKNVAIVLEPPAGGTCRASLVLRSEILPGSVKSTQVPQSAVRTAILERVDDADLTVGDKASYPAS